MPSKRRVVDMIVKVSVPMGCTAKEARREVRTLINQQCNYRLDYNEIRVKKISSTFRTTAKGALRCRSAV